MEEEARAVQLLEDLVRAERELLDTYAVHCKERVFGYPHLFLYGAARRTLAQSRAFRACVEDRNGLVALALTRLQLDTVLRLYALFWVADPDAFAKTVLDGGQIDRMKAADGNQMKDKYLIGRLESRNPWIGRVYKNTSGLIHFSERHIQAAIQVTDATTGAVELMIGPNNPRHTLADYRESLEAFLHITLMVVVAARDWFERHDPLRTIDPAEAEAAIESGAIGRSR